MNVKIGHCPICNHEEFNEYTSCKDYLVSREIFKIVSCKKCGFKFTNPIPSKNTLSNYYESDDYISHSNKKSGIINIAYQIARKFTLRKKLSIINKYTNNQDKILDIGCGTGEFLYTCKNNGWDITGVEPAIQAAEKASKLNGIQIQSSIEEIHENNQFDIITLWHVLEHLPDLNQVFQKIKSKVKPKGTIIVAVPNYQSYDADFYKKYWAGYDLPRHLYHFDQTSMSNLVENSDMKIIKTIPQKLDAYYTSLLSSKYKNGKFNYIQAISKGYKSNKLANINNLNYSSLIYVISK